MIAKTGMREWKQWIAILGIGTGLIGSQCAKAEVHASKGATLDMSTYIGTIDREKAIGSVVDAQGNVFVAGQTEARIGYVFDRGKQIFVSKFSPDGKRLFHVYFGGKNDEYVYGIAIDPQGNPVVTGLTFSEDNSYTDEDESFPTTDDAFQKTYGRVFVSKLNAEGTDLIYSTFLGGVESQAVTVDKHGMIYVTGEGGRDLHGTPGAYQAEAGSSLYGFGSPFVVKLDPSKPGSAGLVYATFFGGDTGGEGYSIQVDDAGNAYVAGDAEPGFTTTANAAQKSYGGGINDAFIAKLDPTGSKLLYATYLGGSDYDAATGLAIDAEDNAYVTGSTYLDFPTTPNAFQKEYNLGNCSGSFEIKACSDAFVAKLDPTGSNFLYSTYLGGNYHDWGRGILVDKSGVATIVGRTLALNFPTVDPIQESTSGGYDGFISRLSADGSKLLFSTYLGGEGDDDITGPTWASENSIYVTGETWAKDFPTKTPDQDSNLGETDAFLTKITFQDGAATPITPGDVNGDGKVNISDATLVLQIAVGVGSATAEQKLAADFNGDGKISVADATAILRKAVGL